MIRRTLWDIPFVKGFKNLTAEQKEALIDQLVAGDDYFQSLDPRAQRFCRSELTKAVPGRRLRRLRHLARRIFWIGETWSERQRREQTEAAREFTQCVIDRNTERIPPPNSVEFDHRDGLEARRPLNGNEKPTDSTVN